MYNHQYAPAEQVLSPGPRPLDTLPPTSLPRSLPVGPAPAGNWGTSPQPGYPYPIGGGYVQQRGRRWRWGCGDIAYGILLAFGLGIVFVIPLIVAGTDEKSLAIQLFGALATWIGLGGWALFVSWVKGSGSLRVDFGWAFRWYDVFIGFGMTFAMFVISIVLAVVQHSAGVESATNTDFLQDQQQQQGGPGLTYLGLTLMVAVGAPVVEELFFRGLTFSAFQKRFGSAVAVIGSTLIFGLMHFQPGPLVPTLFLLLNLTLFGLVLGLGRWYFKRTGPAVFSHVFFNLTAALVILSGAAGGS